jgi:hypothetical protein
VASFTFEGTALELVVAGEGQFQLQIDEAEPLNIDLDSDSAFSTLKLAESLANGPHRVRLEVVDGIMLIDGYIVASRSNLLLNRAGSLLMVLATLGGVWAMWQYRQEG